MFQTVHQDIEPMTLLKDISKDMNRLAADFKCPSSRVLLLYSQRENLNHLYLAPPSQFAFQAKTEEPTIILNVPTGNYLKHQVLKQLIFQKYISSTTQISFALVIDFQDILTNRFNSFPKHASDILNHTRIAQNVGTLIIIKGAPETNQKFITQCLEEYMQNPVADAHSKQLLTEAYQTATICILTNEALKNKDGCQETIASKLNCLQWIELSQLRMYEQDRANTKAQLQTRLQQAHEKTEHSARGLFEALQSKFEHYEGGTLQEFKQHINKLNRLYQAFKTFSYGQDQIENLQSALMEAIDIQDEELDTLTEQLTLLSQFTTLPFTSSLPSPFISQKEIQISPEELEKIISKIEPKAGPCSIM